MSKSSCSSSERMRSPSSVPPGSRKVTCGTCTACRFSDTRATWVVFPTPSGPSRTISLPRGTARRSGQRDDRARRALLDPVEDPVVHAHHELVEVLLGHDRALVRRVLLLHLLRRLLPAGDHLLGALPEPLHRLEERHRLLVAAQRVVGALDRLVLGG